MEIVGLIFAVLVVVLAIRSRSPGRLLLIAARSLVQHRRRTILLGSAIAGVTALLVVLNGLSAGIRDTMLESATTLMSGHITVGGFYKVTAGTSAPLVTDHKQVIEAIKKEVPELDYLVDRGRGWAKLVSDTGSRQVGLAGVDIDNEPGFRKVVEVIEGDINGLREPGTMLLFEELATKLEVKVGDTLTISTTTGRGVANTLDVRLVAIARNVGLMSSWNTFMPAASLRRLYELNDNSTGAIYVYLKDMKDISKVQERLRLRLPTYGYKLMDANPQAFFMKFEAVNREDWTGQKLDITNWEEEISFMSWTLQTINSLSVILILILLVIIIIGIMNTMWIAIRERTREIGTLRAIGMQRASVSFMFMMEALLLGIGGTLLGAVLGIGVATLLNRAQITVPLEVQLFLMSDQLSLSIEPGSVFNAVVIISFVTMLASIFPAYRAARLKPITAMHHIG